MYLSRYAILACGRYEETHSFSDHERFVVARRRAAGFQPEEPGGRRQATGSRSTAHDTVRRVIVRSMAPNVVASIRDMFKQAADGLIKELVGKRSFDGVHDLARVFPTAVFQKLLVCMKTTRTGRGLRLDGLQRDRTGQRSAALGDGQGADVVPWITAACERQHLENTGIGGIIYGGRRWQITEHEAGMLVRSLFQQAWTRRSAVLPAPLLSDRQSGCICGAQGVTQSRPAFRRNLAYVRARHSFCRTANLDTEVAGAPIEEGSKILYLGSANLDEEYWPNASTFDINRLTGWTPFWMGIHNCRDRTLLALKPKPC